MGLGLGSDMRLGSGLGLGLGLRLRLGSESGVRIMVRVREWHAVTGETGVITRVIGEGRSVAAVTVERNQVAVTHPHHLTANMQLTQIITK